MTAAKGPDRVGWPCACGCLEVVPPFTGKGPHVRRFATAACCNRDRQRRWKAMNPERSAEQKKRSKMFGGQA